MANKKEQCELGMVGLGVMGCNLLLNMSDNGYSVAGYDTNKSKADALNNQAEGRKIVATTDIKEFIASLKKPRSIMMLVPAGSPVDAVIQDLLPHLDKGDLIIDAGNSYYKDTDVRERDLGLKGIDFIGVGVSGGEEGARHGPSMMPGGPKPAYDRISKVLEAVSAKVNGDPCVTYLGPRSAGHFVKMVHNGIEYAIMQVLAESYDLMKRGLGMSDDELAEVYTEWDEHGDLNGYLMEITSHIFSKVDDKTGNRLIDMIKAVAKQKGTGMWTSQTAMSLVIPTPTIDIAVSMRDISGYADEREQADNLYHQEIRAYHGDKKQFIEHLRRAVLSAVITAYAQGMALLFVASKEYQYDLNLEAVARIWRGGCIIRSVLLEDIRKAYDAKKDLPNILLDNNFAKKIHDCDSSLREVLRAVMDMRIAAPALAATLGYLDSYRSAWVPANLIQAQRDYFGSHTYERIDEKGTFHTQWTKK